MLTAAQRKKIKSDIARRLMQATGPLAAELFQRGLLTAPEERELLRALDEHGRMTLRGRIKMRGAWFAAELANADRLLAARVVLRGRISRDELLRLNSFLGIQPRAVGSSRATKLDELIRVVERALAEREKQ